MNFSRNAALWIIIVLLLFALFNLVASGPPAFRVEELLALCRAGVVQPLGSGMRVRLDESTGRYRAGVSIYYFEEPLSGDES